MTSADMPAGCSICDYCGQMVQVENGQAAEDVCDCRKAIDVRTSWRRREEQITQAKMDISECFAGDGNFLPLPDDTRDQVIRLLEAAVEPVVDMVVRKVSVQAYGMRGTISRSGGDKIIIERSDTVKMKKES